MSLRNKIIIFTATLLALLFIMEALIFATTDRGPERERLILIPDGMYLVLRSADSPSSLTPIKEGEMLLNLKPDDGEATAPGNPTALVLHDEPEVPLVLAREPHGKYEDGELEISIELEETAKEKLGALTSRPQETEVVIVIGNEIVSWHKVREKITEGKLMIACRSSSCPYLFDRLKASFTKVEL